MVEETLVVAEVVGVDLKVVADVGQAFGAGDGADRVVVDCDGDGARGAEDVGDCGEGGGVGGEADAWCWSVLSQEEVSLGVGIPLGSTMAKWDAMRCRSSSSSMDEGISMSRAVCGFSPRR